MPEEHPLERFKKMLFDDVPMKNMQEHGELECPQGHCFGNSRFEDRSLGENINNQIANDESFNQNKRERDYNPYAGTKHSSVYVAQRSSTGMKTRSRTSPRQLEILESVCRTTLKPNKELRIRLSRELSMTERQVQIWFQNKRAKSKKIAEKDGSFESKYDINRYNRYDVDNCPMHRYEHSYPYAHPYKAEYAANADYTYPNDVRNYDAQNYEANEAIDQIEYPGMFYDPRTYMSECQDTMCSRGLPPVGYYYEYNSQNHSQSHKEGGDIGSLRHQQHFDDQDSECPGGFFYSRDEGFNASNNNK